MIECQSDSHALLAERDIKLYVSILGDDEATSVMVMTIYLSCKQVKFTAERHSCLADVDTSIMNGTNCVLCSAYLIQLTAKEAA